MKLLETTFVVELTKDDIEVIAGALHSCYMANRSDVEAQALRNAFAELVNRRFMGEDA